ncbi:glycosyl hydrolase family 43 [Pedobacter cryophilus]|uniref:Glycosyl hydrolase family 43 n=2 Tax=Pedobacter cryophilus TaxID=2571271 RepID=A0A4U1BTJ3_9SPHI|nr:glycosyl hydrolase family 43 [Pedobacter cryophilus]
MVILTNKPKFALFIFGFFLLLQLNSLAQKHSPKGFDAIYSGIPWYTQDGNTVSAHGASIVKDNGKFYLFGESKTDSSNAFAGFSCYSSSDLYNWKFEKMVLPVQETGKLGPNRVGERVKVLKCPKTGEYVMFMHVDDLSYKDQFIGYATSNTINGTYTFKGALLFDGKPIKKWDMGMYQDTDEKGYLITHSGNLYQLSDDYKSVTQQLVSNMTSQCESPAIFKKDGIYFWLGSGLTSWERNDNYYFTATSLKGPWTERGLFAPKETLTWNSQTTYVLPIEGSKDTTFLFMGDRWSFPRQNSSATYVWQPLTINGNSISLPDFKESWQLNISTGEWKTTDIKGKKIDDLNTKLINYQGNWTHSPNHSSSISRSDAKESSFSINFKGKQVGMFGNSGPDGGYAKIIIQNKKGEIIHSSIIDMYCKYSESSLKFLSPILTKGNYKLTVSVMGEHGNWSNKKGTLFGSSGNFISLDKIIVNN